MSNTKYKAIIFDLGQVIININFEKSLEYWALKSNLSKGDLVNKHKIASHHRRELQKLSVTQYTRYHRFYSTLFG